MAAEPPRPKNGARAKATAPEARATTPTQRAKPMAEAGEICIAGQRRERGAADPGRAGHGRRRRWPSRSGGRPASRRRSGASRAGVAATNSRLPRRASAASVPDRARTDQRAAMSPSDAPVFQPIEPPSVSMFAGNGFP